jgi:hypothetical protein
MQRRWHTIAVIATLILAQPPGRSHALCGLMPFKWHVHYVELVFAGTVVRATPEMLPSRAIVTRYYFTDLRYAKGSGPADTLVLTSQGGKVGRVGLSAEDEVHFQVNRRYVAFARRLDRQIGEGYGPTPCSAGPFLVEPDSAFGERNVHGSRGWPTTPPSNEYTGSWGLWQKREPGTPVSESDFLDQIRLIVREQAAADSLRAAPAAQPRGSAPGTQPRGSVVPGEPHGTAPPAVEATPPQPPVRVRPVPGAK